MNQCSGNCEAVPIKSRRSYSEARIRICPYAALRPHVDEMIAAAYVPFGPCTWAVATNKALLIPKFPTPSTFPPSRYHMASARPFAPS